MQYPVERMYRKTGTAQNVALHRLIVSNIIKDLAKKNAPTPAVDGVSKGTIEIRGNSVIVYANTIENENPCKYLEGKISVCSKVRNMIGDSRNAEKMKLAVCPSSRVHSQKMHMTAARPSVASFKFASHHEKSKHSHIAISISLHSLCIGGPGQCHQIDILCSTHEETCLNFPAFISGTSSDSQSNYLCIRGHVLSMLRTKTVHEKDVPYRIYKAKSCVVQPGCRIDYRSQNGNCMNNTGLDDFLPFSFHFKSKDCIFNLSPARFVVSLALLQERFALLDGKLDAQEVTAKIEAISGSCCNIVSSKDLLLRICLQSIASSFSKELQLKSFRGSETFGTRVDTSHYPYAGSWTSETGIDMVSATSLLSSSVRIRNGPIVGDWVISGGLGGLGMLAASYVLQQESCSSIVACSRSVHLSSGLSSLAGTGSSLLTISKYAHFSSILSSSSRPHGYNRQNEQPYWLGLVPSLWW